MLKHLLDDKTGWGMDTKNILHLKLERRDVLHHRKSVIGNIVVRDIIRIKSADEYVHDCWKIKELMSHSEEVVWFLPAMRKAKAMAVSLSLCSRGKFSSEFALLKSRRPIKSNMIPTAI